MRLTLIAPGATTGTRASVFGDVGGLLAAPGELPVRAGRAILCGPEPACLQTSAGAEPRVLDDLAQPDFGAWTGLGLDQVLARDPAGLREWAADPRARPHGGESLAGHLSRVGALLDSQSWSEQGSVVVATTFTVRAACVHALGAGADTLGHLDVAPGTVATISRHTGRWRLQAIVPPHHG